MRVVKRINICLILVCALIGLCSCKGKEHSLVGSWKDVDEDYYVVFNDSGHYHDSIYNLGLQYLDSGDHVSYYTPAGDMIYVEPEWTFRGNLRLYIGGAFRELKSVNATQDMYDWAEQSAFKPKQATVSYTAKSGSGVYSTLYLDDSNRYLYGITVPTLYWEGSMQGLVARSDDSRDYLLYFDEGNRVEMLRSSPYGEYLGALPLAVDGPLIVEKSYNNLALGEQRGYVLDGVLSIPQSGVTYTFTTDDRCVKSTPAGYSIEYTYYIGTEGLVALLPAMGIIETDYMYYDADQNIMYRLVYQRDSWYDFVSELIVEPVAEEKESKPWRLNASIAMPSTRSEHLPVAYSVEDSFLYPLLSDLDMDYTLWGFQCISEVMQQIQADENLRKEYVAQQESAQERLRKQMESDEREWSKVKAIMDARVEAELASGQVSNLSGSLSDLPVYSDSSASDDLSWLDAFLASLENKPSYDQDANPSGPVVNTDDAESSGTPESATSTAPPSTDTEIPDAEVSQFDPAFYVDFVCTCVNCHVQALPVELNADDILLVDADVIEPGTYLSVEGYGMVVARASGGYTSGQTAVLYSSSHNAVNRFSSGMYNVYKVVG